MRVLGSGRFVQPAPQQPAFVASPTIRSVRAPAAGGTVSAEHAQAIDAEVLGISDGSPDQGFATSVAPGPRPTRGEIVRTVTDDGRKRSGTRCRASSPRVRSTTTSCGTAPAARSASGRRSVTRTAPLDAAPPHRPGPKSRDRISHRRRRDRQRRRRHRRRAAKRSHRSGERVEPDARVRWGGRRDDRQPPAPRTIGSANRSAGGNQRGLRAPRRGPTIDRTGALPTPPVESGEDQFRLLAVPCPCGQPGDGDLDVRTFELPGRPAALALDERRVLGTTVEIGTTHFCGVSVVALVVARPGRPAAVVRERATEAINRFLDPVVGGIDGHGWPFDVDLRANAVSACSKTSKGLIESRRCSCSTDLRTGQRHGSGRNVILLR